MQIEQVDERDSSWEQHDPRFRVYFFEGPPPTYASHVDTYDVIEAELLDVVRWAQDRAGAEKLWSVALVAQDELRRRGLVWLVGCDANAGDSESLKAMMARRGNAVVLPEPRS